AERQHAAGPARAGRVPGGGGRLTGGPAERARHHGTRVPTAGTRVPASAGTAWSAAPHHGLLEVRGDVVRLVRALGPGHRLDRAAARHQVGQAGGVGLAGRERPGRLRVVAPREVAEERDLALLLAAVVDAVEGDGWVVVVGRRIAAQRLDLHRHVVRRGRLVLGVEIDVREVAGDAALLDRHHRQ